MTATNINNEQTGNAATESIPVILYGKTLEVGVEVIAPIQPDFQGTDLQQAPSELTTHVLSVICLSHPLYQLIRRYCDQPRPIPGRSMWKEQWTVSKMLIYTGMIRGSCDGDTVFY